MKFIIKHEIRGRVRIHTGQTDMSYKAADCLYYYLFSLANVTDAKVYEATGDAVIRYVGRREDMITALREYQYETQVQRQNPTLWEHSGRALNAEYREKLLTKVFLRGAGLLLVPLSLRAVWSVFKSLKYIGKALKKIKERKMTVEILDATAIVASLLRQNYSTASAVMFLLTVGEILEEWTQKKSVKDLARRMSLNVENVWTRVNGTEVLRPADRITEDDLVVVRMGNVIPFDGEVREGIAMINQASLTGESAAVKKETGGYVYAGTVVAEGELVIAVKEASGTTRYEKIVALIEDTQLLKSRVEGRALRLADKLVPVTLAGALVTGLLTGSFTKALAVLMVDYSCALKLAVPISVLSAIREASVYHINVKGGKFLEAVADAETIIFDKTGTLTKSRPVVTRVIPFDGEDEVEMLRVAACLEEHFPHSMAKAVVKAASDRNISHAEMHSRVEYVVAHGISTTVDLKNAIIGSYHYVFEDNQAVVPAGEAAKFAALPPECSLLYLAIDGRLKAVICIEDSLRAEAAAVVTSLRKAGFKRIVMMTGDSDKTARYIAAKVGVDRYYSEVLPEDKARYVQQLKERGDKVIMVGDGINDSPALSAADVGIAVSDGAEIAREIADITISADNLYEIVTLKMLSVSLMKRINRNYHSIIGINTLLILLGVGGVITPTTSALLHNASTIAISVKSMENLLS